LKEKRNRKLYKKGDCKSNSKLNGKWQGKWVTLVTNVVLGVCLLSITSVAFAGQSVSAVTVDDSKVYYGNEDAQSGVCLMFNVYEHTDYVQEILEILSQYEAKATFFLGGSWADDNIDCVRQIYNAGQEVASHGYFHKDHSAMNYAQNLEEISVSAKLINLICNTQIKLFAPPSGAYNEQTLQACETLQLNVIMWSRDTIDWRDQNTALIVSRATKNLKAGEFVLMHPTKCTVQALPQILQYINENQLETQSVSENIGV
jgi:peptidoglycan/xylan/chitin deacetylase (PgdA/CDA1 family)